jgi:hypothetical protein
MDVENTDSSTGGEGNEEKEKVTFTPEQQAVFDREIGKKTWAMREKEREAEELRQKLAEFESAKEQEQRPVVPDEPDPLDEDYEARQREREQQVAAAARYDERQKVLTEQRERAEQEKQQKAQQAQAEKVQVYTKRAGELGVTVDELQEAGNMVAQSGIAEDVADMIISDDKGPLITKALASDINKLVEFSRMTPIQQAIEVNRIKSAVLPQSSAPDPFDVPNGSGVKGQRGPKGATYE